MGWSREDLTNPWPERREANGAFRARAFTLVEILVAIAIIAVLMAILLPALGRSMGSARGFRCQMSLRSVAFDFGVFADDQLHGDRKDDRTELGEARFRLETFQESQYGLDEFWNDRWGADELTHTLPDAASNDPMRCAEVRGPITLRASTPCSQGAISPSQNISYTFNVRLHRAEVMDGAGRPKAVPVILNSDIMQQGMVPLVWDVDGAAAYAKDQTPVFSGPSLDSQVFGQDDYWFPALRHNGAGNFAFIDGHVRSSMRPLAETDWAWDFQPVRK